MQTDDDSLSAPVVADSDFGPLLEMLSTAYNFDFREYKEVSLARRIRARMSQLRIDAFGAYARYLEQHPQEHITLFNTILINVTGFFRDPEAWITLAGDVLPRIVADAQQSRSIRVWSAGCSSGEEPYSIAMLLAEQLGDRASDYAVRIYGTDIDEEALNTARHGIYRIDQLKDVPDAILQRYFNRDGHLYRVRRDLRRWCIFGGHNLTQAPPLSHIDLLVCRNVLIYFRAELQDRVLSRFHYAVRRGGFLFLGRSESLLTRSQLFAPVSLKWRIFQRTSQTAAHQPTAALPERTPAVPVAEHPGHAEAPEIGTRVQRALDALPASTVLIDLADTILFWNAAAAQLFEIPAPSAVGRKFRDLDISYRVEGLRARIEDVKSRRASTRMDDITFTRRNGELVHAEISLIHVHEGDRPVGILVFAVEASEHARLKEQMSRVAEQHATAIEELQSTNEELETTNEELQSTNEELETTNEELQSTNEELETTVEELQATNAELAAVNEDREQRAAELMHLDQRHRGLLDSFEYGVAVLDLGGNVETWNHAAERLWGVRQEQLLGRSLLTGPPDELSAQARAAHDSLLAGRESQRVVAATYTVPGGESREVTLRFTPLKSPQGESLGIVVVMIPSEAPRGRAPRAPD